MQLDVQSVSELRIAQVCGEPLSRQCTVCCASTGVTSIATTTTMQLEAAWSESWHPCNHHHSVSRACTCCTVRNTCAHMLGNPVLVGTSTACRLIHSAAQHTTLRAPSSPTHLKAAHAHTAALHLALPSTQHTSAELSKHPHTSNPAPCMHRAAQSARSFTTTASTPTPAWRAHRARR